jgi:bacillithiol synthase
MPRLTFQAAIADRAGTSYPRHDLVQVLEAQYQALSEQAAVRANIQALLRENTFTVTTAHQPSLLLGPLYFIYKAITTIRLAEQVSASTGHPIVPVFVLGSEDHDLGKKIQWEPAETGAVGSMSLQAMPQVLEQLAQILGESEPAQALLARIRQAYTSANDFAAATQALLHDFLGRFGLVVINMNTPVLKRHFIPVMKAELLEQRAFQVVNATIARLQERGFKAQAAPREINLFYMTPGRRERIVLDNGTYKVLNTDLAFSREAILAELEQAPERFSPNVVLRPLFQEIILPNLAYVGGGGELAYWLERLDVFDTFGQPFPVLIRRNSVLWLEGDVLKKMAKLDFEPAAFFADTEFLVRQFVEKNAAAEVSLNTEADQLKQIFQQIATKASLIDPTLEKAVRADEVKTQGLIEQWESRLVRAEKQKHEISIQQIRALKEKLFPGNGLQERSENFLSYVLKYGDDYFDILHQHLDPFEKEFILLK